MCIPWWPYLSRLPTYNLWLPHLNYCLFTEKFEAKGRPPRHVTRLTGSTSWSGLTRRQRRRRRQNRSLLEGSSLTLTSWTSTIKKSNLTPTISTQNAFERDTLITSLTTSKKIFWYGREPWSSDYGRQLMFKRPWVRIPATYTRWIWHFSHLFAVKIVFFVWKEWK